MDNQLTYLSLEVKYLMLSCTFARRVLVKHVYTKQGATSVPMHTREQ